MAERQITIKDVAEKAGVSVATVSRILNHSGRFSKETEKRVRRIIYELGYVPQRFGGGLYSKPFPTVGIIVPDIKNPYYASLVLRIQTGLFKLGYTCIICNTDESEDIERRQISSVRAYNVSGIVLISGRRYYAELRKFPTVYLDRPPIEPETLEVTIESDNEQGGYLATKELIRSGCRHIAIIEDMLLEDENQNRRYRGYLRALQDGGMKLESDLHMITATADMQEAYYAVQKALRHRLKFDGIVATTDELAVGAYRAILDSGYRIPEDIRLTGNDDSIYAEICGTGITSIHQDIEQMADLTNRLLVKMIEGGKAEKKSYVVPVFLVRRKSSEGM